MILGTLGRLVWRRCYACGTVFSSPYPAICPACGADDDPYGEEAERVYWDDDSDDD